MTVLPLFFKFTKMYSVPPRRACMFVSSKGQSVLVLRKHYDRIGKSVNYLKDLGSSSSPSQHQFSHL